MKIFSKMLSKKPKPEETVGNIDLDDLEPLRRSSRPVADDSGEPNASVKESGPADLAKPLAPREEEPEALASGWENSDWDDDDWDDDEDWGDDDLDIEERRMTEDKNHLVSEIREAMNSVGEAKPERRRVISRLGDQDVEEVHPRDWSNDEEFGRKAIARSQLMGPDAEQRIMEKTETVMTDRETSRRRSAMAHLKAAAAATKADRVLRHVAGHDTSGDAEEQSPYRDDLAKVVRPHSASRPISRQVSQPMPSAAVWDQGEADEDAALHAAAAEGPDAQGMSIEDELDAAEAERLARAPVDLSEEEFSDDSTFGGGYEDDDTDFPSSPFASRAAQTSEPMNAFRADDPEDADEEDAGFAGNRFAEDEMLADEEFDDDGFGDDAFADDGFDEEEDDFAPRPSRAVSEAVAFANAPDEVDEGPREEEVRKKIWEMADEVASELERARKVEPAEREDILNVSAAVAGRSAGRSAGRVKTRLLGFQSGEAAPKDVFEETAEKAESAPAQFPAGWIIVTAGPGRGACFTLHVGVSQIGRGEGQAVRLDFGDTSISRNNHAAVAYDDEQGKFYLGHGGKSNLVRLNGRPVLSTEEMVTGDEIRIGETALKFVALCGEDFTWTGSKEDSAPNA